MVYYYDTSALCRYYHEEPGSDVVEAIIDQAGATHIASWLTVLEATSAFALKFRTGEISQSQFNLLRDGLRLDIKAKRIQVARVLQRHYAIAEQLMLTHSLNRRLRSLDAIHLGIALDLRSAGRIDTLVSADATVVEIAKRELLPVVDPLNP